MFNCKLIGISNINRFVKHILNCILISSAEIYTIYTFSTKRVQGYECVKNIE